MKDDKYIDAFYKKAIQGKGGNVFKNIEDLWEYVRNLSVRDYTEYVTAIVQQQQDMVVPSIFGAISDPTDETFSGLVISHKGQEIDGVIYSFAIVVDGVVVTGLGDDGGTPVVIGGGDVYSDSSSSTIYNIPVFSDTSGKHIADADVSVGLLGGRGGVYYFSEAAADIAGYKTIVRDYASATSGSTTKACTAAAGVEIIEEFVSEAIAAPMFLAGTFNFEGYFSANVNQNAVINFDVYVRDAGGTETLIVSTNNIGLSALTGTPSKVGLSTYFTSTTYTALTDRIVVKATCNVTSDADITFTFGSITHPSFATFPFMPPADSGDVISDAASSIVGYVPIFSDTDGKHITDNVDAGIGTDDAGGDVSLVAGAGDGTGDGGAASLLAGSASNGYGGDAFVVGGTSTGDKGGGVFITGGESAIADGGDVTITGGATTSGDGDTGDIYLVTTFPAGAGERGKVIIQADVDVTDGQYLLNGVPLSDSGDMLAATYDPDGIEADVFDVNNSNTKTGLADGAYSGDSEAGAAGAALAFGELAYLQTSDSRWEKVDASAKATCSNRIGICVLAAAGDGSATRILSRGNVRADAVFPAMDIGAPMYASVTAGEISGTPPSSNAGEIIRHVGHANTANELHFEPSGNYYEIG